MIRTPAVHAVLMLLAVLPASAERGAPDALSGGEATPFASDAGWLAFELEPAPDDAPIVSLGLIQDEPGASQVLTGAHRAYLFGEKGSRRINLLGKFGSDFDGNSFGGGTVELEWFIADKLAFDLSFSALNVRQRGPDTWGGSIGIGLRWHIISRDVWSLYLDGGGEFIKTSDDVPPDGSSWNFAPQAGGGITFDIGNDWRAMIGVRYHHLGNADLADSNPGRDSVLFYGGISVPF